MEKISNFEEKRNSTNNKKKCKKTTIKIERFWSKKTHTLSNQVNFILKLLSTRAETL